jgi:hypothetical protein
MDVAQKALKELYIDLSKIHGQGRFAKQERKKMIDLFLSEYPQFTNLLKPKPKESLYGKNI